MADPKIFIRRSATPNKVPTIDQLALGELAINTYDGKLYLEQDQGAVGVGTTIINVNPWSVGLGSTAHNIYFTAGSVGIGTTNPSSKLHIVGNALVTGIITASSLSGYQTLVGTASSATKTFTVTVANKTANHRYFGSGSSQGYFIDGVESPFITLLPGKTYRFDQADGSNGSHPLRFYLEANRTTQYTTNVTTNGTAGSAGAYTEITIVDTTPIVLHYQCSNHAGMGNAVSNDSNFIDTPYQITARSGVNVTGVVTATDFNSTSDISLKDNIRPIDNSAQIINGLEGVRFVWKADGKESIGVIAQEIEKTLPELVSNGDIKTVNYNGLIGVLIEAVKDQQKQINELKIELQDFKKFKGELK